jgi:polysaccharide biosynthesis protein PslE
MTPFHQNRPQGEFGDITLRDLVAPLFRRKRPMIGAFVAFTILASLAAYVLSSSYKVKMEFLVDRERVDPTVTAQTTTGGPTSQLPLTEEEINSEAEILVSPDVLKQVVLANNLQERERHSITGKIVNPQNEEWYVSRAVEHLGKELSIEVVKKTNMIGVTYKSTDPKTAYGVMDKLANLYMQKHLTVHRPSGSFEFFSKETDRSKEALAKSETALAEFGSTEGVVAPEVQRTNLAQLSMNTLGSLHNAQQAIAAADQRIATDEKQMQATPARSTTQQVSNSADVLLQQLQQNLLAAQVKRTQLIMKYDANYPLVKEADKEIAQTEAAIEDAKKVQYVNQTTDRDPTFEFLREDVARAKTELASQRATEAALKQSLKEVQIEMVNLDKKALKQQDLLREAKADESNYLLYLAKREQERTSDALDEKRIGNVSIAVPPVFPLLPATSPFLIMAVGLFVAFFMSVGLAFVLDYFDSSFRTPAEVLETLRIPVLGAVPKQSGNT